MFSCVNVKEFGYGGFKGICIFYFRTSVKLYCSD